MISSTRLRTITMIKRIKQITPTAPPAAASEINTNTILLNNCSFKQRRKRIIKTTISLYQFISNEIIMKYVDSEDNS